MKLRVIIAGVLGGVAIFLWGFVSHMLLPLGEAGIRGLPYEDKVLPAISASVKEPGLYLFPWPESPPGKPMPMSQQTQQAAEELYKTAPHGLLLFYPPGGTMLSSAQLLAEFATNCASALLAAALVSALVASLRSFVARVLFVTLIGLSAGIAVNVPHWNWYGFPAAFTLAEILEHVVGFGVAGVVIAAVIRPAPSAATVPSRADAQPMVEQR
jgi:hypothetical protein